MTPPCTGCKTNSKLILKTYDKNLLQSNGRFGNREIPIDGYFAWGRIPSFGDSTALCFFLSLPHQKETSWLRRKTHSRKTPNSLSC